MPFSFVWACLRPPKNGVSPPQKAPNHAVVGASSEPDAVLLLTGALDDGALDAGALDGEVLDSAGLDPTAPESAGVDSAALDAGPVDPAALDSGALDSGVLDTGVLDAEALETAAADELLEPATAVPLLELQLARSSATAPVMAAKAVRFIWTPLIVVNDGRRSSSLMKSARSSEAQLLKCATGRSRLSMKAAPAG